MQQASSSFTVLYFICTARLTHFLMLLHKNTGWIGDESNIYLYIGGFLERSAYDARLASNDSQTLEQFGFYSGRFAVRFLDCAFVPA